MKIFLLLNLILFISVFGCSSSDQRDRPVNDILNGEPVVPRNANKVFFRPFAFHRNSKISQKLNLKVKELINMDGRLTITEDIKLADLKLEGTIKSYIIQKKKFGDMGKAVKKRMRITVDLKLINVKRGKIIFFDREIQSFKEYSEIIPPVTTERQVLELVINNLALRIKEKTITGWFTKYMTPEEKGLKSN